MRKGYTLIEILVSLLVVSTIFSAALVSFRDFSRRQNVTAGARQLRVDLRLAQNQTLAGNKPVGCGVFDSIQFRRVSNSTYVIEARCSGPALTAVIGTKQMPNGSLMSTFSPTNTIVFKALADGTNLTSNVTIVVTAPGTSYTESVVISQTGEVK